MLKMINYKDVHNHISNDTLSEIKDKYTPVVYEYFSDFVPILKKQKHANIFKNLQYGIFLDKIIRFYLLGNVINKNSNQLALELDIDSEIANYILTSFTNYVNKDGIFKFCKNSDTKLKNYYYCFVLTMFLREFQIDSESFCASLKIDNNEFLNKLKIFSNISFSKKQDKSNDKKKSMNVSYVEMKIPLKFQFDNDYKKKR